MTGFTGVEVCSNSTTLCYWRGHGSCGSFVVRGWWEDKDEVIALHTDGVQRHHGEYARVDKSTCFDDGMRLEGFEFGASCGC